MGGFEESLGLEQECQSLNGGVCWSRCLIGKGLKLSISLIKRVISRYKLREITRLNV
jgi:hypothetical protein